MVLVTTPELVLTVAYGQTTVVAVSTMVVTPPYVCCPAGTDVVAAPQTVVVSLMVTVVAGMVYVPGVGQTETAGVGRGISGVMVLVGTFTAGGGGGAKVEVVTGAEVETDGATEELGAGGLWMRVASP